MDALRLCNPSRFPKIILLHHRSILFRYRLDFLRLHLKFFPCQVRFYFAVACVLFCCFLSFSFFYYPFFLPAAVVAAAALRNLSVSNHPSLVAHCL